MGYKYKNSWGKVVDTELKYKYENVNAKYFKLLYLRLTK